MMIGFIIPLRSINKSKNWNLDVLLVQRTIRSILAQTDSNLRVLLVYSDRPDIDVNDNRFSAIPFPHKFLTFNEISDFDTYAKKYYDRYWAEASMDQGRKTMFGCKILKEAGCHYIMAVDSDDLLSNKIAAFVNNHISADNPGWFVNKGYVYNEKKRLLIKKRKNMQMINSSTHIIRTDLIPIQPNDSLSLWENNFFAAHGYLRDRIFQHYSLRLKPIPFYASIYSANGINWSTITEISSLQNIKSLLKRAFNYAFISKKKRNEFGLYNINI